MGNEQGALERAQNLFGERSPPGPQCPVNTAAQTSSTIGTGDETTTAAKDKMTSTPMQSPNDVVYTGSEKENLNELPCLLLTKDTTERTMRHVEEQHGVGTAAFSFIATKEPDRNKEGDLKGTEDANFHVASENCDEDKETKSSTAVHSAPLLIDPSVPNGAGAEGSCVLTPDKINMPRLGQVNIKDKEQGNEKLDASLKHKDHSTHDKNNPSCPPTGQTIYPLPALLHIWKTTNSYSGRQTKVATQNSVSDKEDCLGENGQEHTPLTGWRLCERDVYCDSSPPSAQRGSAGISPVAACGSPACQFQHHVQAPVVAFRAPQMRAILSPTRSAAVPPPPPLPCDQPLTDGSSLHRGQTNPSFDASEPPFHATHADTQRATYFSSQGTAPRGARLNPFAPAFEPHQSIQQLHLLQHLRAATTVSGASTTCSLRSAQGAPSVTPILVHDTRAPLGRTMSYAFPQHQLYSPILRCSSTGPSVTQQRPLPVPYPPFPSSRMGGPETWKRGLNSGAQLTTTSTRYNTIPSHPGYRPINRGTFWSFGAGRVAAPYTSRSLDGGLAEVVDPAEANKRLLELGRKMRLTHLQIQVVVKKAGPSGLRLTDLPAAFLKEHNAVLDLRSIWLLQIRELIAGMGRTLILEADDDPPLGPEKTILADGAEDGRRFTETEERASTSPSSSRSTIVSTLTPRITEQNNAGNQHDVSPQKPHTGDGVHGQHCLQGAKHTTGESASLQTPCFVAVDEESRLRLKLGKPLPPVMQELLQHLLVSLVADALHHATPATFVAAWAPTVGPPDKPDDGLSKPPAHAMSVATVMSPETLSPHALASQSPETWVPSLRTSSFESFPGVVFSRPPTENMLEVALPKEGERKPSKNAASLGTPGFSEGMRSKNIVGNSRSSGTKNKGLPIHILPTLWQLKYGLRCNLSAMLETCGYTSLTAFILEELPCLQISPSGSQVTLRLTPTSPQYSPKAAHTTINAAADGKQLTLQDGSTFAPQNPGSPCTHSHKLTTHHSNLNAAIPQLERRPIVSSVKELNSTSLLSMNKATHPSTEAVATAAAAAVQASGMPFPTLLVALSSAGRRAADRGADAGSPAGGESKCGEYPQTLRSTELRRDTAGPEEYALETSVGSTGEPSSLIPHGSLRGSPLQDKECSWPVVDNEGTEKDRPQQPMKEASLDDSEYPDKTVDNAISKAAPSNEKLLQTSPNSIQQTGPPLASSLPVETRIQFKAGVMSSCPQSHDHTCTEVARDIGPDVQMSDSQAKRSEIENQKHVAQVKCEMVSRLQLHRMLYEVIAIGCEKRGRRWARGEDLIELEELQEFEAVALKNKDIQALGTKGGKGHISAAVAGGQVAGTLTKQTDNNPSFFDFSSSLPSSTGCETSGEGGGQSSSCSPPEALQEGDTDQHPLNSSDEDGNGEAGRHPPGYSSSSVATKGDETEPDEKKTDTEAGKATPEAGETTQLVDARLLRRRMKKREKKEKKKRKKEKLRALDEHEMDQKRLLDLVDLLQLPPSPSSTPQLPPGTSSSFSLKEHNDAPSSPFPCASPSSDKPLSGVTAPAPATLSLPLLGHFEQMGNASGSTDETRSPAVLSNVDATSEGVAGTASVVASRPPRPIGRITAAALSDGRSVGISGEFGDNLGDTEQLHSAFTFHQRPRSQLHPSRSPEELATELQSFHNRAVGMLVSAIKVEWERRFGPRTPPLQAYMDHFQVRQLKALLLEVPNLLILGAGGKMRVSTLEHAMQFCNPFPPPSTVIVCTSGKKINLPLTMTPSSPLPWFRAHAYTYDVGSNSASVLAHLEKTDTVETESRHSHGGEREVGDAPEGGHRNINHQGKRRREKTVDVNEECGKSHGRASIALWNERRQTAEHDTVKKQRDGCNDRSAYERLTREGERDSAPLDPPAVSRRGVPPERPLTYMQHSQLLPSHLPHRVQPPVRLMNQTDGIRSSSLPSLLMQSESHQTGRYEMRKDTKCVVPRGPSGSSANGEKQEGLNRYALRSYPMRMAPHLSSFTKPDEQQRRLNDEAVETLWKVALQKQRETCGNTVHPIFSSESHSVYPVPPPGFNNVPPVKDTLHPFAGGCVSGAVPPSSLCPPLGFLTFPFGQNVSPVMTSYGSPSRSALPRPSQLETTMNWRGGPRPDSRGPNGWLTASARRPDRQGPTLSHLPRAVAQKPLPPDTIADLERLLVRLLLMDSATGSAAAAAAVVLRALPQVVSNLNADPGPSTSPEEPSGVVPDSSLSSLLTLVKAAQQLHRRSDENLRSHDDRETARDDPTQKRDADSQQLLMTDMDPRSQSLSFHSSCASTPHSSPTQEAPDVRSPFPVPLHSLPQPTHLTVYADDKREDHGVPRRFAGCSGINCPFPAPPGLTGPLTTPPPGLENPETSLDNIRDDSFGGNQECLRNLDEQARIASALHRLHRQGHKSPRPMTLLGGNQADTASPGDWQPDLPVSFCFPGSALVSSVSGVSIKNMIPSAHATETAETRSRGDNNFNENRSLVNPLKKKENTEHEHAQRVTHDAAALETDRHSGVVQPMQGHQQICYQPRAVTADHGTMLGSAPLTSQTPLGLGIANWEQKLMTEGETTQKKGLVHHKASSPHHALDKEAHQNHFVSATLVDLSRPPDSLFSSPAGSNDGGWLASRRVLGASTENATGQDMFTGMREVGEFCLKSKRITPKKSSPAEQRLALDEGQKTKRVGRDSEHMELQHRKQAADMLTETLQQENGAAAPGLRSSSTSGLRREVEWTQETSAEEDHAKTGKDALLGSPNCSGGDSAETEKKQKKQVPWTRLHPSRRTGSRSRVRKRKESSRGHKASVLDPPKEPSGGPGSEQRTQEDDAYSRSRSVSFSDPSLPYAFSSRLASPFSARVPVVRVQPVKRRDRAKTKNPADAAGGPSSEPHRQANQSPARQMSWRKRGKSLISNRKKELHAATGHAARDAVSMLHPRGTSSRQRTNSEGRKSVVSPQHRGKNTRQERRASVERQKDVQRGRGKFRTQDGKQIGTPGSLPPSGIRESLLWQKKSSEKETAMSNQPGKPLDG